MYTSPFPDFTWAYTVYVSTKFKLFLVDMFLDTDVKLQNNQSHGNTGLMKNNMSACIR